MAGRQHHAVKLGLRAKYKLPSAHHLLSSFAYGSAKSWVSGLTSKHSASFEDPVNIIYSIINFQINVYLFLDSWVHFLFLLMFLHTTKCLKYFQL